MNTIGTLQESSLHAALKAWYAQPGDQLEASVDGSIIDIVRGDLLIEIQTRNFVSIKRKLSRLSSNHPIRLIYPIAREKWIVRLDADLQTQVSRRKSPKHGRVEQLFMELVNIASLVKLPNLTLEVLFIQEEEVWSKAGRGWRRSWRRGGWSRHDRRLLAVVDHLVLETPEDFCTLLPAALPQPFTNYDLSRSLGQPRYLAQRMSYCLRQMGAIEVAGNRGRVLLFRKTPPQIHTAIRG